MTPHIRIGKTFVAITLALSMVWSPAAAHAAATTVATVPVGAAPTGLAFTSDEQEVFVASSGSNTVDVVSVSSKTVTHTIPVGSGPMDVAMTPDGTLAFVPNYYSGTVTVIDVAAYSVINTIFLTGGPGFSIVINATGTRAIVPTAASGVDIIDVPNQTVLHHVSISPLPTYAAFSPDGKTAYVTDSADGDVTVVDVESGNILHTWTLSLGMPYGIVVDASGRFAYVAKYSGASGTTVAVVDTTTGLVVDSLTTGANPIRTTLTPDGEHLLVTTQWGGLDVVPLDGSALASIPVGDDSREAVITADGSLAAASSVSANTVTFIAFDPPFAPPADPPVDPPATLATTGVDSGTMIFGFGLAAVTALSGIGLLIRSRSRRSPIK